MSKVIFFYVVIISIVSMIRGIIDFYIAKKNKFDCNKCKVIGCQGKTCIKCRG